MAQCLTTGTGQRYDPETETLIPTHGGGFDVATAYRTTGNAGCYETGDKVDALTTGTDPNSHVIAFDLAQITSATNRSNAEPGLPASTISKHSRMHIAATAVRRLTAIECERLQGFPDNYTLIPYRNKPADQCPDGPRYKALGNSMAVPVMRWIGERINMVRRLAEREAA